RLGRREPSSPAKFTLGLFFLSFSFLLIVPAARYYQLHGQRVSPFWLIGLYFLQMCGELCLSPVGLSMVTKLSPARIVGFMMGAGGMGEVYRAHDEKLGRDVAIKVLPADQLGDAVARGRLLREARSAAALNHPHICTIFEVGETEEQAYIAMELIDGRPLSDLIERRSVSKEQSIRYSLQIADALAHAHDRGI